MDLERVAVTLRPRSDWEAADLGCALVRAWWRRVYTAWLAFAAPFAVAAILLFDGWGLLAFWWLLPLFEALTLTVLSRTVFSDPPLLAGVLRQAPKDWPRLVPDLLWRRFSPARSYAMPVTLLERSAGAVRRARLGALDSSPSNVPAALTLAFVLFEICLALALIGTLIMMMPGSLGASWDSLDEIIRGHYGPLFLKGFYLTPAVAMLFLGPFYTAAGFCIYLNRRTELEGWDLEIVFRSMALRLRQVQRTSGVGPPHGSEEPGDLEDGGLEDGDLEDGDLDDPRGSEDAGSSESPAAGPAAPRVARNLLLAGLVAASLAATGSEAAAQEAAERVPALAPRQPAPVQPALVTPAEVAPAEAVSEVLEREEMQTMVEVERWRLRGDLDWIDWRAEDTPRQADDSILADLTEMLLWGCLGLFTLLMFRELRATKARRRLPGEAPEKPILAERVAGLDVRRESLPDDVAAAAEELWRRERRVEALGLLYRGALAKLAAGGLELRESFTEADCLAASRRHLTTEVARFFAELTGAWQSAAYAHRLPTDSAGLELCQGWRGAFGPGAVTGVGEGQGS